MSDFSYDIKESIAILSEKNGYTKELNLISTITEQQIVMLLEKFKVENPKAVEDFKTDPKVQSFIIGYVMKNTQGKANGEIVKNLISKMF